MLYFPSLLSLRHFLFCLRAYRSVQPPEKGRSNSVDGSSAPLDRRHVSLSPVISSPESITAQQSQLLKQSTSSSPVPTHYSNETGIYLFFVFVYCSLILISIVKDRALL